MDKQEFKPVPKIELFTMAVYGKENVMNKSSVEHYQKYYKDVGTPVSIGEAGPDDVLVRMTYHSYRNCYAQAKYEISSATKLSEYDLQCIRARYDFMTGQATAHVRDLENPQMRDGRFIYVAESICDSSD